MGKEAAREWNKRGKNRKIRQTEEEKKIAELLDGVDEKDLIQISAVRSGVSLPLPNQERLAWSVIDRADLADEEEWERRRKFNQMLRRKKWIHALCICGIVAVVLVVLALLGVFDRFNPPAYEEYYIAHGVSFQGETPQTTLPKDIEIGIPSLAREPLVVSEKLDTTIYHALTEYCSANQYAVGEYQIQNRDYVVLDGELYLKCSVLAECMDYRKKAGKKTWKDLGYTNIGMDSVSGRLYQTKQEEGQADLPEDVQEGWLGLPNSRLISIDENMPVNMYIAYITLYIDIRS